MERVPAERRGAPAVLKQRKQHERNAQLQRKAMIKSRYARVLKKEEAAHGGILKVPDNIARVMEEAHEQAPENVLEKDTEETEQERRRGETPPPKRARPDSAASPRAKAPVAGEKTTKQAKPDPFYREKREFAALQAQRAAEQAERERLLQEQASGRKAYFKERAKTRALMTARTSKGQPRLGNQIERILEKLKSDRRQPTA